MPVTIEIQGIGRVELGISEADWDNMTDGERQEVVTRVAVASGAVRPNSDLASAALSSVTDALPGSLANGAAALGRATGLTSDDTNRALIDYASRQRAEAAASYQRDPTVADTVGQGWQQDGIRGAARSLATQGAEGIGPAIPSVAATAGALALGAGTGGLAIPMIAGLAGAGLDAALTADSQQQERIRQGLDPNLTPGDLGAVAGSSAINLIPGGRSAGVVGSALRMAGREGLENAAQEGLTLGSVAAQAPDGAQTPGVTEYVDRLTNAGAVGAATGGVLGGVGGATRRSIGATMDLAAGEQSRRFVPDNEEVAQAERRVLESMGETRQALAEQNGRAPDSDEVIRTVRLQQAREATALITASRDAGEISPEVFSDLRTAVQDAVAHTRQFFESDPNRATVDGGLNMIDRARRTTDTQTGMSQETAAVLRRTLFDMDVASRNFKKNSRIGPLEIAGNVAGRIAGRAAAGTSGVLAAGPIGALAGVVPGSANLGGYLGTRIGRRLDRALGWQEPSVVRRAKAIAEKVKSDGTTTRDIQREADAARIRAAERRGEAEAERTKIAQERADARALVTKARKEARAMDIAESAGRWMERTMARVARTGSQRRQGAIDQEMKVEERSRSMVEREASRVEGMAYRAQKRAESKTMARRPDITDRTEPVVVREAPAAPPKPSEFYGPKPRISVRAETRAKARQAERITSGKPGADGRPNASERLLRVARDAAGDRQSDAGVHDGLDPAPIRNRMSYEDTVARAQSLRKAVEDYADRLHSPELRTAALAIAELRNKADRTARAEEAIRGVDDLDAPDTTKAQIKEALRLLGQTGGRNDGNMSVVTRAESRARRKGQSSNS